MAKPRVFEKPLGMRDLLPETVLYKRQLEHSIQQCLRRWGYEEIVTPTLEYYDTIGEASLIEEDKLFKLLDRGGNTLVLRPDMTAPIARVISSILRNEPLPLRLSYHGNVFRAQEKEAGRHAEFFQSGVELIGDGSAEADAEIVALAVDCLRQAGVKDFRIALGSMAYVDRLFAEVISNKEDEDQLKQYL
ncbi:MAG: ATP phosphoribosyltransferase regulatory subunit, partial [Bacilli bacterium]